MSDVFPNKPDPHELLDAALTNAPFDMAANYEHITPEQERKNVVANRLAKNIGPLLGVPDPTGPFGEMSWLCNFTQLSLGEIARGASEPTREELQDLGACTTHTADWYIVGRGAYGKMPNHIASATMNQFAPDTKAGAMLTGINRLLEPQALTLTEALATDRFASLSPQEKVQACGNMIFRAYAPQPLLFEAGIYARNIQQALRPLRWPVADQLKDTPFARCEIPAIQPDEKEKKRNPFDFNIVDGAADSLVQTLDWSYAPSSSLVALGIIHAIRASSVKHIQSGYNSATGRHIIWSDEDPSKMGSRLVRELQPYVATT